VNLLATHIALVGLHLPPRVFIIGEPGIGKSRLVESKQ
jgi:MoxR-like ATPase